MLFAAESGRTVIDENLANAAMIMQEFSHIYEGTALEAKPSGHSWVTVPVMTMRCGLKPMPPRYHSDLEIIRHGQGLISWSNYEALIGRLTAGSLLRFMVLPKEFIPTSKGYFSIPIDISDLVSGAYYWRY